MSPLQRNTLIGLVASILLAALKLVAGIVGCSTALIADSIESLADSVGSLLVWQALKVAARPADDRHPWGYGKAEAVAALLTGVLLVAAALLMTVQSIHEILLPHQPPAWWTLLLLASVTVSKELLFRFMIRDAVAETSDAATADAAATLIANAVDVEGEAVTRVRAMTLDPDSDLGERLVTVAVGPLTSDQIEAALAAGLDRAEGFRHRGLIIAAALTLRGRTVTTEAWLALPAGQTGEA